MTTRPERVSEVIVASLARGEGGSGQPLIGKLAREPARPVHQPETTMRRNLKIL